MARTGIQIAQDGINLDRAADYQKVLDDRWPFLTVAWEGGWTRTVTDYTQADHTELMVVYEHNLGYIPAFTSYRKAPTPGQETGLEGASVTMVADDKNIYAWVNVFNTDGSFFSNAPLRFEYFVRVYECDITRDFIQPVDDPYPVSDNSVSRYGARVLKEGKRDMGSDNLSDYTLNTRGKSLSVQRTGLAVVNENYVEGQDYQGIFTVEHRLGYPPIFAIAQYATDNTYSGGPSDVLGGRPRLGPIGYALRVRANAINISFRGGQSALPPQSKWAYVILKDPLEGSS